MILKRQSQISCFKKRVRIFEINKKSRNLLKGQSLKSELAPEYAELMK